MNIYSDKKKLSKPPSTEYQSICDIIADLKAIDFKKKPITANRVINVHQEDMDLFREIRFYYERILKRHLSYPDIMKILIYKELELLRRYF